MEIKFLNISFKEKYKYIIKNFNLLIKSNEITGIYGDNSNLIIKLLKENIKYEGNILIDGKPLSNYNQNLIAYIKKDLKDIFLTKTVSDEFYLIKKEILSDKNSYIKKIVASLNMVGLQENILEREINTLSKSEKKLLQIALNLIINPDIIILEEPFLYLDKSNKSDISKILFDLKKKYKKTIIIISNDINILYDICNFLIIIKNNKLLINDKGSLIFNNLDLLIQNEIDLPNIIKFNKIALNYGKKIKNHKDVKDLIKEVYKDVFYNKKET